MYVTKCSIFNTVQIILPGLRAELHALTLAARFYVLLSYRDYATLHRFLSILLDEQQSIMGYVLLLCSSLHKMCMKPEDKSG